MRPPGESVFFVVLTFRLVLIGWRFGPDLPLPFHNANPDPDVAAF